MTECISNCTTQFFMASNQVYSDTINNAGQAQLPEAIGSAAYQPPPALSLPSEQTLIIFHKKSHPWLQFSHKDTSQGNVWNFADHSSTSPLS